MLESAVIGTGAVAELHAAAISRIADAKLTSAASLGGLEQFCAKHEIAGRYTTLEDLLEHERPDVVHLCTPPGVHKDQALAALRAGAHVIVEKPAALTLGDLDDMVAEAKRVDRRLVVVFQQRSGSALRAIRDAYRNQSLGRGLIGFAQTLWYRDADYFAVPWRGHFETEGGGTLLNHSIHQIDLLAYLLGDWESAEARMWTLDRDIETEDVAMGIVKFTSGAVSNIVGSALSPRQSSEVRVDTTAATIAVSHLYGHAAPNWSVTGTDGVDMADDLVPAPDVPSGHDDFLGQVYASLVTGDELPDVARWPVRAMEIAAALYASARRGGSPVTRDEVISDAKLRGSFAVNTLGPGDRL